MPRFARFCSLPPLLGLLLASGGCGPRLDAEETNLLLIVVDTLRADHLGAWGYPYATSPNLDRMASEGVRFARYHSTSSWTRPGFATLLTGLYPRQAGIYEERFDRLPADVTTLAERLREAGYRTFGVNSNPNIDSYFGFNQGFDRFLDSGRVWPWMKGRAKGKLINKKQKNMGLPDAKQSTDRALAALAKQGMDSTDGPWFMMVVYIDPHSPYAPPLEQKARVGASKTPSYDGELRYVDQEVQRLITGLTAAGQMENTLVVFTSDHGEGLADYEGIPLAAHHGEPIYDALTHVPLVLHHPQLKPRVVDELVSAVDLVPTLLDLLGLPADPQIPGHSLEPLVTGTGAVEGLPDHVFAESDWRVTRKVSVRTDGWRYIHNRSAQLLQEQGAHEERQLHEEQRKLLEGPIFELYERAGGFESWQANRTKAEPDRRAQLAALIQSWEARTPSRPPENRHPSDGIRLKDGSFTKTTAVGGDAQLDPELEARLKVLGYLGEDNGPATPATP